MVSYKFIGHHKTPSNLFSFIFLGPDFCPEWIARNWWPDSLLESSDTKKVNTKTENDIRWNVLFFFHNLGELQRIDVENAHPDADLVITLMQMHQNWAHPHARTHVIPVI